MLGLLVALLAGGEAGLFKHIPGPGRKIYYYRLVLLGLWETFSTILVGKLFPQDLTCSHKTGKNTLNNTIS